MVEVGYDNRPVHHDLKTAPGAWVELRRLPYDEILKRREMGTKMSMNAVERRKRKGQKVDRSEENKVGIEVMQVVTREYEFSNCIVDHNLEVQGTPVDFSQPRLAFKVVDPRILQEIELLLQELNMETDEEELEDFMTVVKPSSSEEETQNSSGGSEQLKSASSG